MDFAGSSPEQLVEDAVATGVIPGAVLAAGIGSAEPALLHVTGDAQRDQQATRPMTADTIFDLASLTKVAATTPVALRLIAAGNIGLDDPVRRYLPEFAGLGKENVTVRQLLTHTAGLPDHRKYYEYLDEAGRVRAAALSEPLVCRPGTTFAYSDVGFITLGELCATVAGEALDQLARELVYEPLGMSGTGFRPRAVLAGRIASTELVGGVAKTGVVHDENAEVMGGVAGHAGLFGTAADLARYAAAWAVPDSEAGLALRLPAWLTAEALRCQTDGVAGQPARRGLGWGLRRDRWDNMGDGWPATGAGHTGFTGTSLSIDPVTGLWTVLLTNAVHFGRGPEHSVVGLRKNVHATTAAVLLDRVVQ
jgi:CubicO group peptidase (beta-lactamase class C family)